MFRDFEGILLHEDVKGILSNSGTPTYTRNTGRKHFKLVESVRLIHEKEKEQVSEKPFGLEVPLGH
jgi:hypothetical protein